MVSSGVVLLNQEVTGDGVSPSVNIAPQTRGELSFEWEFGDGTNSSGEDVVHNYSQIGNYSVNLTLTDDEGYMYNHSSVVSVVSLKSEFDYTVNTSGGSNLVCFDDVSEGLYEIKNWSWDLGDGNISFNQFVNHTYSLPGMYNVTLNVTDIQTNRHSYQQLINIETIEPCIGNVTQSAYTVGTYTNITINASAFDVDSGLDKILLNVSYPDKTFNSFDGEYNNTVDMLENDNATGFIIIRDNIINIEDWMISIPLV